jgi:hypothetical protein
VGVGGNSAAPGEIRIFEDSDNGTHYTGFKAGNNTASVAYVLPTADGSSGTQLTTDGSGTLSWSAATLALGNDGNNRITTGTGSGGLNAEANLTFDGSTLALTGAATISTNLDVDGTTNLDVVDIDGAVQLDATLTVGANDQGYDVILYGDTASANVTWDTSADDLIFNGAAGLIVPDGQFTLGSTAITSTGAEINILDGGNAASSVTIADADRIILNDNGTMKQVAVSALNSYTSSSIAADDIGTGNAAVTITTSSGNITIDAAANDSDVIFKGTDNTADITMLTLDGSDAGHATFNNAITSGAVITSGAGLVIADAGNIGSASDTDAIAIASNGQVTLTQTLIGTSLDISADIDVDGTSNLDIVDIDGAVNIAADVTIASTNKIIFNDASQFIQGASGTVLDIAATDEIELTATLIEVVGNATVSGTLAVTGVTTSNAGVVVDNITIDGTEIDLSSGDLTLDVAGDIILDAGGGDLLFNVATTNILAITNSSSDVIIKPVVDTKDIIFQQRDGTSILEINDGAYAKFTAAAVAPEATLTDASTVTINALTQSVSKVTLGGNRTIGLASGGVSGAFISILVIQDGTGSRTVTWNAAYEFAADTAPTLTATANLGDLFVFRYNGAKWLETGRNLALTLS